MKENSPFLEMDFSFLTHETKFEPWSGSHIWAMGIFLIIAAIVILHGKNNLDRAGQKRLLFFLTLIPFIAVICYTGWRYFSGQFSIQEDLPVHVCRILALLAPWVYGSRKKRWTGICYYWIMVGTLNACLTPDLPYEFPHVEYWCYFVMHLGLLLLPLYYCIVCDHRPTLKDLGSALIAANVFLLLSLVVNLILGSNYMYTMDKPPAASLLDVMGPWPIYLLTVQVVGAFLFFISFLPFWFLNKKQSNVREIITD